MLSSPCVLDNWTIFAFVVILGSIGVGCRVRPNVDRRWYIEVLCKVDGLDVLCKVSHFVLDLIGVSTSKSYVKLMDSMRYLKFSTLFWT